MQKEGQHRPHWRPLLSGEYCGNPRVVKMVHHCDIDQWNAVNFWSASHAAFFSSKSAFTDSLNLSLLMLKLQRAIMSLKWVNDRSWWMLVNSQDQTVSQMFIEAQAGCPSWTANQLPTSIWCLHPQSPAGQRGQRFRRESHEQNKRK